MQYITRSLERKFIRMSSFFKAVLVTGARQVGKTTMLRHLAEGQGRAYVTLDNLMARNLAKADPVLFFQTYKPPIIIDEVQYAPELFSQIKVICDEADSSGTDAAGLFWLTGSQQFSLMKNVSETLAGRICILELYSLSKNEKDGVFFDNELDFTLSCFKRRQIQASKNNVVNIFEHIWQGGMPQVIGADPELRREYYNAYVSTYLMRDVAEFGGVSDSFRFGKFLMACAALVSERISYKTLAETAEVSQPTAKEWLRLLAGMGVVYLLQPYASNELKRIAKTPKLYFCDTGLAASLSMWLTRDALLNGAASGRYFENFVVIELLKNFAYSQDKAILTYYRDSNAKEIDVIVERNGLTHPLEIKKSANPSSLEARKFSVLDMPSIARGCGGIICMCEEAIPIDPANCFMPCNLI